MPKQSVLAIDDAEDIHDLLAHWLENDNLQIYKAKNGANGIQLAQELLPDLVLIDIMMVGIDGYEVCQQIKQNPQTSSIPMIFLTGKNEPIDKIKGLDLGAIDYITKPFDPAELQARVRAALRTKQLQDALDKEIQQKDQVAAELRKHKEILEELVKERTEAYIQEHEIALAAQRENEENRQLLIISEKMAALGLHLAGIAHEINTPSSAILFGINEIERNFALLTEQIFNNIEIIPSAMHKQYLSICQDAINPSPKISTKEQRQQARKFKEILIEHGVTNASSISKQLTSAGFKASHVDNLIELLALTDLDIMQNIQQLNDTQTNIQQIKIAIGRIMRISSALRTYSRQDKALSQTHLEEDLESTLIILENKLKRGITVIKEYETIPAIQCYADQLGQVWTNMIHNAIQAMNYQGTLTLRLKNDDQRIIIEIEDNGSGIQQENLGQIFEIGYTTKEKREGTGLGLAICKNIIQRHQGTISVKSAPGKTCFYIAIPVNLNENESVP